MARRANLLALFLVWALGCNPRADPPAAMAVGECAPDSDLCSVDGDCCRFDGSTRSGAALCVNFGDAAECTGICYADGDCETGCCGALVEDTGYGVCSPCSTDPFEPAEPVTPDEPAGDDCLQGVELFCACVDTLGVPCGADGRALFEESCASGAPPADTFNCWAGFSGGTCGDALETCS